MSASVSIVHLSWCAPDGTPFFRDLDLSFGDERTGIVGRNGSGKSTLLRLITGELAPAEGRVQLGGSVAMMRQDVLGAPHETIADFFGIRSALDRLERAAAGLALEEDVLDIDWSLPARAEAALLRCGLSADLLTPVAALSGGQRSRAALAATVFAAPDILLLDEPTNNLDRAGREAVIELIGGWAGTAIVVSHDRALLQRMDAIVELTTLGAKRYGGNYDRFAEAKARERDAARRDLAGAERNLAETVRRAQEARERKARKDSAGQRARAKGCQSKIMMDFAKGRAEASGGASVRLRQNRRDVAVDALASARDRIEVLEPVAMDIPSTGLATGKVVLRLNGITGGHDPDHPIIRDLTVTLTGPKRLAISGPNGCGKTTLLHMIAGQLLPRQGRVEVMVPFRVLDQHLGVLDTGTTLVENYQRLNPVADLRIAQAALARFGFRAAGARKMVQELSGGERLRAGLACVLGGTPAPQMLILDEPTNHLDFDGLTTLEAALAAYDGALLVVSHDVEFLAAIRPDHFLDLNTI